MITLLFLRTWLGVCAVAGVVLVVEYVVFGGWRGWFLVAAPITLVALVVVSKAMLSDWRHGRANGDYRYLIIRDRD